MKYLLIIPIVLCALHAVSQPVGDTEIMNQADILINNYQFRQALSLMNASGDSLNVDMLKRKGHCHARLGNYTDAIIAYEKIKETDSLNREALHQLGQLYSRNDRYDLAKACYKKLIAIDSMNSFYHRQYADVAVKANDLLTAIAHYLQAINLNPADVEAHSQLGSILLHAEQYQFADSLLTAGLAFSESHQLRLLLARAKLGQQQYQAVIENVNQLLTAVDTLHSYARLLGISYFQTDQYEKVIPCMEFLLKSGVEADWIFYYLGVSYQQTRQPELGIEYLNMAIEAGISDNIGTYYTQLGMAYEEIKDFKNAIRSYRAAYESSKSDILLYHLARNYDVYYKDKTQAMVYYKKYLNSDDTIQIAKQYSRQRFDILSDLP